MDTGENALKPIIIYSKNPLVKNVLVTLCKLKKLKYSIDLNNTIKLAKSYNGPAIVDGDITIYYFSQIIQYLEQRRKIPAALPHDPKTYALTMIITMELLSNPHNHQKTIDEAIKTKNPFITDEPTILDIAIATITSDSTYTQQILTCQ